MCKIPSWRELCRPVGDFNHATARRRLLLGCKITVDTTLNLSYRPRTHAPQRGVRAECVRNESGMGVEYGRNERKVQCDMRTIFKSYCVPASRGHTYTHASSRPGSLRHSGIVQERRKAATALAESDSHSSFEMGAGAGAARSLPIFNCALGQSGAYFLDTWLIFDGFKPVRKSTACGCRGYVGLHDGVGVSSVSGIVAMVNRVHLRAYFSQV